MFTLCSHAAAQHADTRPRSFVRAVLPAQSLPDRFLPIYSALVGHAEYPARGLVVVHDGTAWRIWLQRVASYGVTAPTSWVILDEVILSADYALENFFPPSECSIDGESVRGLVAFASSQDADTMSPVAEAWLVDGEVLRQVSGDRLYCERTDC